MADQVRALGAEALVIQGDVRNPKDLQVLAGSLDRIDALRAVAMLWMTVFHFAFDLDHFRLIDQDFHRDPFWTWQRSAIVSLFLFTAGLSQAVALAQGQGWPSHPTRSGHVPRPPHPARR